MTGVGIAVAMAASVTNTLATVLEAREDRRSQIKQGGRASLLLGLAHRPRWLAGTGLMVIAWPLQVLALALAPITVVQPILSTSPLLPLGVARVTLRERAGPVEACAALAILGGIAAVVWAAPRHTTHHPDTARVAAPLIAVGVGAVLTYALGRVRPRRGVSFVIGAGLAYAWVDFVNKLLADDLSNGLWLLAIVWLLATVSVGGLAFLEETSAFQRRPAVTVAPVSSAVHDPLPVLMALWSGVEVWGSAPHRIIPLIAGLAVITAGAAVLGRSRAVAQVSRETDIRPGVGLEHSRPRGRRWLPRSAWPADTLSLDRGRPPGHSRAS